ncbi:hypothetical protein [uncultured Helicobacter sp.]|uniref:hypothetical protein n=1 Tax=uncultured Helicobacter sp. TaxID=175537 RepID=UPI00262428F4|nr:hypothetical protein [uncultured Helicobacter sp.]
MKKYPLGILLCATCDSAFVIGALLANIKEKCADKVDIFYLIHDGFSKSDKKALKHRQEARFYAHIIAKKPHLKLPPLESYEDYKSAIYEKQTFSYRLGASLIQACKTIHKGGLVKFYKEAKRLQKESREKYAPKILS